MKRKIIAIAMLVVGSCLILYPIIGNIINVIRQNTIQAQYNTMVQSMNDETKQAIKDEAAEYNKRLATGEIYVASTDEDAVEEDYDDGTGYSTALSIGTDELAFIRIPKIDVALPIYRGTNSATLEKGIGHLRNTSLPVGGESSHCVLTGHTGLPSAVLFSDISKLENGDVFYIQYLDEIHAYQVDQIKVVEPSDSSDLAIVDGKDYVTLLTCYPYGINSHRLLVRGERVPYVATISYDTKGKITAVTQEPSEETLDQPVTDGTIFDEFMQNTTKVSVYGMNIPLVPVIIAVVLVLAATAAAVTILVRNVIRQKRGDEKQ